MHNPFTEVVDESTDTDLIEQAAQGSREALEKLILRHQAWIYNIAVRMVFHSQDAEEVTQEVLVKAITRLSTFQGKSQFRTWLYRITANHVLNMKRRGGEIEAQTFSSYADAINDTPDLDLPDPKTMPVDVPLLVEEAKISCTTGMLLCLDRKQRLIFTLGEIFGASDAVGSEILEMSADNFRQSLCPRPPRPLPVHARPVRPGQREQPLPLPEENQGLHRSGACRSRSPAIRPAPSATHLGSGRRYRSDHREYCG
jgi:RNA polymerase sigma factor (sigma-70 family)